MKKTAGKKKASGVKKTVAIQLSRRRMLVWVGIGLCCMLWMFALGVIVGRGLSPVRFDVDKLKRELMALKEEALKRQEEAMGTGTEDSTAPTDFGFYEQLTDKKEKARLKTASGALKPVDAHKKAGSPDSSANVLRKKIETAEKDESMIAIAPPPADKALATVEQASAPIEEAPAIVNQAPAAVGQVPIAVDSAPAPVKQAPASAAFTVQVASVRDRERANKVVSGLKSKGFSAYQTAAEVPGKGTYYRVRVGPFSDGNAARAAAAQLRSENLKPMVIRE